MTKKVVKKKQKKGSSAGRFTTKTVDNESFFNFFDEALKEYNEELEAEAEEALSKIPFIITKKTSRNWYIFKVMTSRLDSFFVTRSFLMPSSIILARRPMTLKTSSLTTRRTMRMVRMSPMAMMSRKMRSILKRFNKDFLHIVTSTFIVELSICFMGTHSFPDKHLLEIKFL